MARALISSVLSLLLIATLVWGGCVSCEQFFMRSGTKSCCEANGRCKTKSAPASQNASRECTQIAIEHHKSVDHHSDLQALPAPVVPSLALRQKPATLRREISTLIHPSPPDLQVRNATFII